MYEFYGGSTLQHVIDSLEAKQLDNMVVETNVEQSYGGQYITLKIAVFPKPTREYSGGKKDSHDDFDEALKVIT